MNNEQSQLYNSLDRQLYKLTAEAILPEQQTLNSSQISQNPSLIILGGNTSQDIDPRTITEGNLVSNLNLVNGNIQSANFVTGSTGWRLTAGGDFEGNSGTFRGTLTANSINIPDTTTANSFHVNTDGDAWWGATAIGSATAKILKTGVATFTNATLTGSITATSGTIGGWIIGATTLSSALSGERILLDSSGKKISLFNSSSSEVLKLNYGSGTQAIQLITLVNDDRRGLEFIVNSALGAGSKCITIDNPSSSICIDITDAGSTGLYMAGWSTSAMILSGNSGTSSVLDLTGCTGDYPVVDLTQSGTASNSYGIRITQGTSALKHSLYIDNNADSQVTSCAHFDRAANIDAQAASAIKIDAGNSGTGTAVGIDFVTYKSGIFRVNADATDPTSGGGAATGRIPILVGTTLKYLAYY